MNLHAGFLPHGLPIWSASSAGLFLCRTFRWANLKNIHSLKGNHHDTFNRKHGLCGTDPMAWPR